MKITSQMTRRTALRSAMGAMGALASTGLMSHLIASPLARADGSSCSFTPEQPEGPFYPVKDQHDKDNDLTRRKGTLGKASGQVIYVQGIVRDQHCQPVPGVLVDIWQACESGRYNHPGDPNTSAWLDPNFQYWGRMLTDAEGRYVFKTIIPGFYPAGQGWYRPPHIHYKLNKHGYAEHVTQMYFSGEELNDKDLILKRIPPEDRGSVIVEFVPSPEGYEAGSRIGRFDLTIHSLLD